MILRKAGKFLLYCFAGLMVLVLLLMLAVKLALDRAPQYQAQIKEWVHAQTGFHIGFAHVSPAFRWYGPELYFDRLELRSKDDQRVLARASGGRVAIDVWQLLRSGKLLAGRVELDSPNIVITRLGPASFALASEIHLGGQDSSLAALTLDDLPAGKLVIRRGSLTLQNWNSELPQLPMQDFNLDLRRDEGGVLLAVNAHFPAALGGALSVSGRARGLGDLQTLNWDALVRARDISFAGWRLLLPEYLNRLDAGSGAFELAARGQGATLSRADLDFAAQGVAAQLADGPSATFEQISGALTVIHAQDRWSLMGKRVRTLRAGRRDPDSDFDVSWRDGAAGLLEVRAHTGYLRADALVPLSGLLPGEEVRDRLREIAPTGEWVDTVVALSRRSVDDPWKLQVHGKFRDVGFAPVGRKPGLRGLNGTIAGNEFGGQVAIDAHNGVFSWPRQLPQPVGLEMLRTTLYWKRTPQELLIASPLLEVKTPDASAHGQVAWRQLGDGSSPSLTLVASVENGNVASARNYLPREQIAPPALNWLNRAFVAGHLSHAEAIIQGPILHFPFRDGSGLFLVRLAIDGMTLDYSDGWRPLEKLNAQAEFRNEGLTARLSSGRIGNLKLTAGDARFADFKTGELQVHTAASGDASDALAYLRATPLDGLAEHAFSGVEAAGALDSKVDLFLPFKQFDRRRVLVHLELKGVTLTRSGSTLAATELTGDADIDGAQVVHADVHGRVLGGPVQMTARVPRNRPLTRTQLDFRGTMTAEALHDALSLPAGIVINGQSDWHGVFRMAPEPARERSLRLSSNLSGLELKLPQPLTKAADSSLPSWIEVQWPQTAGLQARLGLGALLRGAFTVESDGSASRLGHVALMFGSGEPVLSDAQTFNVGGSLGRVDLAGWLKMISPDKNAKPLSSYLRDAKFEVAQLDYLGLSFLDVALGLTVNDSGLSIAVGGPNVVGTLSIPTGANSAAPWNLEFERLKFVDEQEPANGGKGGPAQPSGDPHSIPAINFHAAELNWGERQFGDVRATVLKQDDGISLQQLTVSGASFNVSAKGEWRGSDAGLGHIEGALTSSDVQSTMQQLGYAEVIQAKTGRMDFDLKWAGSPTADALSDATGHVQLALDKGQVVGLKPGAGRVLGLASIAALPRRLALDFSDLTDKGLAFDTVRGDFDLRDGNAYTENVLVKGPAAEIGLIGRVGLKNKDYDQTAVVTGSVGSSPLPLAGFVGGPVVGAAVLVFTQVFKQPLKGLARGYYRITGSWDNPTVERIKGAGAAAATAEAPK